MEPQVESNPDAVRAIEQADVIILGPGDLYTSILPNLIVDSLAVHIRISPAKKVFITNIMTKYGETNHFKASDFVFEIEKYLGEGVLNYILVNTNTPEGELLEKYQEQKDEYVKYDEENLKQLSAEVITGDFLRSGQFLRHDSAKLAKAISEIV